MMSQDIPCSPIIVNSRVVVHLYILEYLSIKQENFHNKTVLVTSTKRINHIDRKILKYGANNQIKSMFGRMFQVQMLSKVKIGCFRCMFSKTYLMELSYKNCRIIIFLIELPLQR